MWCVVSYLQETLSHYQRIFGTAQASNNWVLHGNRTTTGLPLLCNDPHLGFTAPGVWLLFDLQCPTYQATGASFVGLPGVVLGHNNRVAWGVTNTGADCQDLYVMQEPAAQSESDGARVRASQYWYKGAWVNYTQRVEVIEVKGADARELVVRESVYGPVITDIQSNKNDPVCRHIT
jgi:penicillin amidase